MDADTNTQPDTGRILKHQIHRMAYGHLGVSGASLSVCRQSLAVIEHFLPVVRDHEDPEVRRVATPLLAMLGMTLRNVSHSMMDEVVSPDALAKAFEEAGLLDDETRYALDQYRERLRYDEWGRVFTVSEQATREADSIAEQLPRLAQQD